MKKLISVLAIAFFVHWGNAQNRNVSISVNRYNDDYSYTARFNKDKTDAAKDVIVKTLGEPTEKTGQTSIWKGKGFSASVRQGRVEMEMDKDDVSKSFQAKFEAMGEEISESVGCKNKPKPPRPPRK